MAALVTFTPLMPMRPVVARDLMPPQTTAELGRVTQSQCADNAVSLTQPAGEQPFPGMSVTFNAPADGTAVLHISADLSVTPGAQALITYRLNGTPPAAMDVNPTRLASHQDYEETRTTLARFPVLQGVHTIDVFWQVSSLNPADAAVARKRCAVVDIPTNTEEPVYWGCSWFPPGGEATITPADGMISMPLSSFTTPVVTGNLVLRIAADINVTPGAELRVAYAVDGGTPVEAAFGPANLANHQEFHETRTTFASIPLTAGDRSISAVWRVLGGPGAFASFSRGCIGIEAPSNAGAATITDCSTSTTGLVPADGQQPLPGLSIAVFMPQAGNAIVQVASDMGVTPGAEVRLAYSVDGGPAIEYAYGPGNLANSQDYWETRSAVAVIPLSAGAHTITPHWRISGGPGASGIFQRGCMTVSPPTVVGGKNFRISTPITMVWDAGNAQTGYTLLKYNTSTAVATLVPQSSGTTSYLDPAAGNGVVYCYVLAATGPTGFLGLGDLECALTGLAAGAAVPGSFTLDFNGPASVELTWSTPFGGLNSILVQRIPLDGSPPSTESLPGTATSTTQALTPAGTCFQLVGFKGITPSTTNVLCGVPGVGTLAANGKTAAAAVAEVAERLQSIGISEALLLDR